jgi:hypothetical protein
MLRRPLLLMSALVAMAQEPVDAALNARLREEGLQKSQVMTLASELCDGFGPRLMASPANHASAQWMVARLQGWGLEAHTERFDFGHPGWTNIWCSAHVLAPYQDPLTVEVVAWTPSTPGLVKGQTYALALPEEPLPAELDAFFASHQGKLRRRIALIGPHKVVPPEFKPSPLRHETASLAERLNPMSEPQVRSMSRPQPKRAGALEPKEISRRLDAFLVAEGSAVRVDDSRLANGQIRAFNNRTYDLKQAVPTVVMRSEDFGRLWRLMGTDKAMTLAFDIRNESHPRFKDGLNVVGELKGSERSEEVVLLGAHRDSWHTGTGATDNGANCAVMMEVLRILKASGFAPRRTLRVVLFDGEELGLLGSQAYVQAHYGTPEAPTPEAERLVAMFNMDAGAGQMRGLSVFGPRAAAVVLHDLLQPWKDLGLVGAAWHRNRPAKPDFADITSFSHRGLPAIGPTQDGLEYFTYTWHTTLDTYERLVPEDLQRNATVLASVVFHLANRPERLPRFQGADLPPLSAGK